MAEGDLLDPTARPLYEAISELGCGAAPGALVERVRRLQRGTPAEDEFALLLCWLGRCTVVHRLDQVQTPANSKETYRVPDLLTVFRYQGRELPVLIEVKTSVKKQPSWRPDYYDALLNYAKCLGLPLLLAWNWTKFGFWTLSDSALFTRGETNYHLSFETAMQHSLMSELAGDFAYLFEPGVGLHLSTPVRKYDDVLLWTFGDVFCSAGLGGTLFRHA